ncbi:capsular polysaccharide biosynthesis protein Cps4F [Streptococcus pneumoniae]|nr:capsular polysaccharide biosynthesis protein Cps4F [Streptococcus pneumoniae]
MALTDYIIFYGRQPSSHMAYFYKEADACLLTLKNENMIGATIPAKLQGYMAAHKPVIAAIDGDAKRVIMESKCGFQTTASDAQGLADFTKQRFMMDTEQWLLNAIDERGDK